MDWDEHIMLIAHTVNVFGSQIKVIGNTGALGQLGRVFDVLLGSKIVVSCWYVFIPSQQKYVGQD